ncbi:MAG: hypothetical protein AB1791_20345 [Chloroflexota bacterium]
MEQVFTLPIHVTGTLAANVSFRWTVPFDCQLIHVAAVGSNANDATVEVGTSADTDGYLVASAVGDSGTPNEYGRSSFTGALLTDSGQFPHLTDGTILAVVVDFDGAAGTAVQNLTVVLTLTKG